MAPEQRPCDKAGPVDWDDDAQISAGLGLLITDEAATTGLGTISDDARFAGTAERFRGDERGMKSGFV